MNRLCLAVEFKAGNGSLRNIHGQTCQVAVDDDDINPLEIIHPLNVRRGVQPDRHVADQAREHSPTHFNIVGRFRIKDITIRRSGRVDGWRNAVKASSPPTTSCRNVQHKVGRLLVLQTDIPAGIATTRILLGGAVINASRQLIDLFFSQVYL